MDADQRDRHGKTITHWSWRNQGFGKDFEASDVLSSSARTVVCRSWGRFHVHRFPRGLEFAFAIMKKEYDIKNRGTLGPGEEDVKDIDIL